MFRSVGAFRERPVRLDSAGRSDSTNSALLRPRDLLQPREWTTDDLVEEVVG